MRCSECPLDVNEELFESLRAWRYDRAKIADVPAFVIFTDATLEAIAALRPKNNQELLTISGIGARKLEEYGVEVLGVPAQRCLIRSRHRGAQYSCLRLPLKTPA